MKAIWILFKQNKYFNLLNVIVSTVFLSLLLVLIVNINHSNIEINTVNNFKNKNLYKVSDTLYDEKEVIFLSDKSNYDVLHNFHKKMEDGTDFRYYNTIWQPIGVADFKGDVIFDAYYEIGENQPPYEADGKSYRTIKSMRLNKTVFDLNNIQLKSGRMFEDEEYSFHENNILPIILGSTFSNTYVLGDTIDIQYYQKKFKGTIIGFFSPLQKIMESNDPEILLDRYMILPVMDFSVSPSSLMNNDFDDKLFIRATLLTNLNGHIITESSPLEIRKLFNNIITETGFSDFTIIGANNIATDVLVKMIESNRIVLYVSTFLLFIIITSIFLFSVYLKIKRNTDTFLVLMISGANLNHIYRIVSYEFVLTNVIGSVIPIIFLLTFTKGSSILIINYLFLAVIFISISTFLISKFIKKTFHNIDMVQRLKG